MIRKPRIVHSRSHSRSPLALDVYGLIRFVGGPLHNQHRRVLTQPTILTDQGGDLHVYNLTEFHMPTGCVFYEYVYAAMSQEEKNRHGSVLMDRELSWTIPKTSKFKKALEALAPH